MDLIKTGIGISKTIRNVGRLRDIVSIFAKHGFAEFITRGVTGNIPNFVLPSSKKGIKQELKEKGDQSIGQIIGYRLRLCFEELGPAFIKFGQLLSTREDILDQSFVKEMKLLRDKVSPVPFSDVERTIEKSIGKNWRENFSNIDANAIGTASIGVVYKGSLHSGEEVVIKVKRPGIDKAIATDFSILQFLATQVEKVSDEIKYLGVSRLVRDFGITLQNELNFNIEALSCKRLKENLVEHDQENVFHIPKIYEVLSSSDVLVMEYIDGIPFSESEKINTHLKDLEPKLNIAVQLFVKTLLQDGFFHADLHGGNFFYLKNGQIGLIDFGLMGRLSKKGRQSFVAIVYSLLTYNYENLVYEFLDVAEYESIPDVDSLINDVRDCLSQFVGLTVQQTDFTLVLSSVINTLKKHQIFLPREWFLVFRAMLTLDGVGKSMGIDFDLFSLLETDITEIVKNNLKTDDLIAEAAWTARDILTSSRTIPRHLRWFVKEWSKRGYAFEISHTGHEKQFEKVTGSITFLAFALITTVFFASGVFCLGTTQIDHWRDIPVLSWVFWGIAAISFIRGSRFLK
jgi:ubiquinone biosynthesis protein